MDELQSMVDGEFRRLGIANGILQTELLHRVFEDLFQLDLSPILTENSGKLIASVRINPEPGIANFQEFGPFADQYPSLLGISGRLKEQMLEHCDSFQFEAIYADPTPSTRKRVFKYHEPEALTLNLRKTKLFLSSGLVAAVVGSSIPAGISAGLGNLPSIASNAYYNIGQNVVVWGIGALAATVAWVAVPLLIRAFRSQRKEFIKYRKGLGIEWIIEDEVRLGREYDRFKPKKENESGDYTGQFDRYSLKPFWKKGIDLKTYLEKNPDRLFYVEIGDNQRTSVILTAEFIVGMYGRNYKTRIVQSYQATDPLTAPKSFIDRRHYKLGSDSKQTLVSP